MAISRFESLDFVSGVIQEPAVKKPHFLRIWVPYHRPTFLTSLTQCLTLLCLRREVFGVQRDRPI